MHLPEATDHAGYHQIQNNKLLQFHLLLGQSEIICQGQIPQKGGTCQA